VGSSWQRLIKCAYVYIYCSVSVCFGVNNIESPNTYDILLLYCWLYKYTHKFRNFDKLFTLPYFVCLFCFDFIRVKCKVLCVLSCTLILIKM